MEAREQKLKKRKERNRETKKEIRKEGRIEWELYTSLALTEQRIAF